MKTDTTEKGPESLIVAAMAGGATSTQAKSVEDAGLATGAHNLDLFYGTPSPGNVNDGAGNPPNPDGIKTD